MSVTKTLTTTTKQREGYADPAELNWEGRAAKRLVDTQVLQVMSSWMRNGQKKTVLCLPAAGWLCERHMASNFPAVPIKFVGLENNQQVHRQMVARAARLNMESKAKYVAFTSGFDTAQAIEHFGLYGEEFDYVYFDYLGGWREEILDDIKKLFSSDLLARNSFLRFTTSLVRGRVTRWEERCGDFTPRRIIDLRAYGNPIPDWKLSGVAQLVTDTAVDHGRLVTTEAIHIYHSQNTVQDRAWPEASFLFKIK